MTHTTEQREIDLVRRFADGTPLSPKDFTFGQANHLIYVTGSGCWALTEYGRSLLNGTVAALPPGDSASCPDEDSYWPPNKALEDHQVHQDALNQQMRNSLCDIEHSEHYFDRDRNRAFVEQDPLGKHQHETGAKLDAGKVRLGLVLGAFSNALVEVGKVGTYGAQKYTDNGWLDVPKGKARYTDALLRHIFAEANESHDPDTNLHHAAHAAWNALARLELILRKRGEE